MNLLEIHSREADNGLQVTAALAVVIPAPVTVPAVIGALLFMVLFYSKVVAVTRHKFGTIARESAWALHLE